MKLLYDIDGLKKIYGSRTVLDIEGLSMEQGKILGLLGPNGAGKTTLLEILAFLRRPDSGTVFFRGEEVEFGNSDLFSLRRKVVLLQQHPIMFSTNVLKNVEFPLKVRKKAKKDRQRIAGELLKLVGMAGFSRAKAYKLSGGETQRVAIAQALACSPEVILMDEPTGSVDVENQIIIERIIREINREKNISIIMTTHDMVQASRIMDEIIYIYDGKLSRSKYENIFSGRIVEGSDGKKHCIVLDKYRFPINAGKSGPVKISIDPEAIKLYENSRDLEGDCHYRGKLVQLTAEKSHVRLLVDVGIPLKVFIQKDDHNDLRLDIGDHIGLYCPPESIEIF